MKLALALTALAIVLAHPVTAGIAAIYTGEISFDQN